MDLTIEVEDYKLNIRSTGIIIHNEKILLHKSIKSDHYALIGGRVKIGEDSENTIKREIQEELGKKVDIIRYISTIENFFEMKGQKYHEIMFIYQIEFTEEEDKKIEYTLDNIEGDEQLHYEWIELKELQDCVVLPEVIKHIIKQNKFPVHTINIK